MEKFDFRASIEWLAAVELPDGSVPFESLRVPHIILRDPLVICDGHKTVVYDQTGNFSGLSVEVQPTAHTAVVRTREACGPCKGRGWVPEPDVEKACWRISTALTEQDTGEDAPFCRTWFDEGWFWGNMGLKEYKVATRCEAVLWAAEAWATERMGKK